MNKNIKVMVTNQPWGRFDLKDGFLSMRAGSRWPQTYEYKGNKIFPYMPFPFFLATATSLLINNDYNVFARDSLAEGDTYEEFYEYVLNFQPDFIIMETSTPSIYNDLKINEHLKEILPKVKIILTGIHFEIETIEFMQQHTTIDYVIYGEYELILLELLNSLNKGRDLSLVNNILYRNNLGEVIKTPRGQSHKMSEFPWPNREMFADTYFDLCCNLERRQLQMSASRGCPFECKFCVWPQLMYGGPCYRTRDPQDVVNEILYQLKQKTYESIYFDDDTFNVNKQHVLEICRLFKKYGIDKIKWGCMGRADLMDDEMLYALKDAGLSSIKYGVESFTQEVIDQSGKHMNVEKNLKNILKTIDLGIEVHLTFALGLQGDTIETVQDTINKAVELPVTNLQMSMATPYPGSVLFKEYEKEGRIITYDWDKYIGNKYSVARIDGMTNKQLEDMCADGLRRFYLNKNQRDLKIFLLDDYMKNLEIELGKYQRILVLQSAARCYTKAIYNSIEKLEKQVFILSHERFKCELENDIPNNKIVYFNETENFCVEEMKNTFEYLKEYEFDCVVVPTRTNDDCEYSNVLQVSRTISNNVYFISKTAYIIKK